MERADHPHPERRPAGQPRRGADDVTRTPPALPYLSPPAAAIDPGPWLQNGAPLPDTLPHWDPNTRLRMIRSVTLDLATIRRTAELPDDATLALVPHWRS